VNYRCAFSLALAGIAITAGCGKIQSTGATVPSEFLSAISPDAQTLFCVKLDQLKASDLYRRHQEQLELPQLNALSARAGLDPRRDLSNILFVWDGKHLLLLAHSTAPTTELESKMTAGGATRIPYKKFTLFTRGADSIAFPDRGLIVAGSTGSVESALTLRDSGGGAIPSDLQERMAEISANAQLWEASRGGLPAANFTFRSDIDSALSNISEFVEGTAFSARFDTGSHFEAHFLCKSAEGAQRVNDALRGLTGLARLSTNDNELDLLRMWDAVSISKDRQSVRVKADFTADLSDKLIAQLGALRGRAGAILNSH
jgi:hypothetical protein